MEKEIIGLISGIIVIMSIIPYAFRTYQKKIKPNPASWLLWSGIGLTLLLTYKSSGAEANVWPAVFGFTNPLIITIFLIKNRAEWKKFEQFEWFCMAFGIISLVAWQQMQGDKYWVQYALYIAMLADACAGVPTVISVWKFPEGERPFAWGLFAAGYFLAVFAISEKTLANYILPIYMCFCSSLITLPLVIHRLRNKIPIRDWV